MKRSAWKVRAADLRRIAAKTPEPERERKMLVLAEELEAAEAKGHPDGNEATGGADWQRHERPSWATP